MAQFETGYPAFRPGDNKNAYDLGCKLLDLQDRLLVKHKNKRVRAMLQFDMPRQLTELCWLILVVERIPDSRKTETEVLDQVTGWTQKLEVLATDLGL